MESTAAKALRTFGVFELDLVSRELRRHDRPVKLPPQASRVLTLLVERSRELVTREEIRQHVWPGEVVDFDQGVNNAVRQIRLALRDHAGSPTYLETVPRRGYRFIAPVAETPPRGQGNASSWGGKARPFARQALGIVLVVILMVGGFEVWKRQASPEQPTGPWTLAVFPFADLSPPPSQDFLAEGLAEELITELAKLDPERLRVIAHGATGAGTTGAVTTGAGATGETAGSPSYEALAEALSLTHYLTGSIRREGDRLRLAVRLLRTGAGECLWAESYDRGIEELLALQREIGIRVSDALALRLAEDLAAADPPSRSREAYFKGRYHLNKNTAEAARLSLAFFKQAIAEDPSYAPAHACLAGAYLALPHDAQNLALAREGVERALALDDSLAEAHGHHGELALLADWDWKTAEESFLRAIRLDPAALEPRSYYAYWLATLGRHEEAIAQIHRTTDLDPVLSVVRADFALIYFLAGRFEAAHKAYASLLELEPDSVMAMDGIFFSLLELRRFEEAKSWSRRLLLRRDAAPEQVEAITTAPPEESARRYLRWLLEVMLRDADLRKSYPAQIAGLYARLGEPDEAFKWLEQALVERSGHMVQIAVAPELGSLHGTPRFEELKKQVGLSAVPSLSRELR